MRKVKSIKIGHRSVNTSEFPLICTPLIAHNAEALVAEAKLVLLTKPDLLEWRVDFFDQLADSSAVIEVAQQLKAVMGDIPLIFTRRAAHEGGEPIIVEEEQIVQMYEAVCDARCVDLIDYELSHPRELLDRLRSAAQKNNIQLIVSYHNFDMTPDQQTLVHTLLDAAQAGADIAKIAVMPTKAEDVLTLLSATLEADKALDIPVITMSMGSYGSISRMIGGQFGSCITFAAAGQSSAPGQLSIEDMHQILGLVNRATSN